MIMEYKKILIIGSPGAGKSVFARALKERLNLPLVHLDMIWHRPDKTELTRDEFLPLVKEIMSGDEWIIDGNYMHTLSIRLAECDTVFLLDIPLDKCLEGARSRIGVKREDMPWVENELDKDFERYIIDFQTNQLPRIYDMLSTIQDKTIIIFKSREEIEEYLKSV